MVSEIVKLLKKKVYQISNKELISINELDDIVEICYKMVSINDEIEKSRDNWRTKYKELKKNANRT